MWYYFKYSYNGKVIKLSIHDDPKDVSMFLIPVTSTEYFLQERKRNIVTCSCMSAYCGKVHRERSV